jgi:hypothetical protein
MKLSNQGWSVSVPLSFQMVTWILIHGISAVSEFSSQQIVFVSLAAHFRCLNRLRRLHFVHEMYTSPVAGSTGAKFSSAIN